jgi:hypothetical protein
MKIVFQLLEVVDAVHIGHFLGDIDAILEIDGKDVREFFFP